MDDFGVRRQSGSGDGAFGRTGNILMRKISARAKAVSRCACPRSPKSDLGAFRTLHSALERLFSGIQFGMDGWGEGGRRARRFGRRARTLVGQISWLMGFRRDAENGDRDGSRSPFQNRGSRCESALYFAGGFFSGSGLTSAATQVISGCPVGTNAAAKCSLGWTFGAIGV